jgi:hypothetical protein
MFIVKWFLGKFLALGLTLGVGMGGTYAYKTYVGPLPTVGGVDLNKLDREQVQKTLQDVADKINAANSRSR